MTEFDPYENGKRHKHELKGRRNELEVFKPKEIKGLLIKNRLVRSATVEHMASEDGRVTNELVELYRTLARGGVGLIITSATYVEPNGKILNHQLGIDRDDHIQGLRKIPQTVHENGHGCRVVAQLVHCGRQSVFLEKTIAPSSVFEPMIKKMPREMTVEEIEETIEAFTYAAKRAMDAGFDGVQLHAAHGYLLSEFLSPYTNKRTDEYGGNTENRTKIVEDIYYRIVERVGNNFPILIKMNVDDFLVGGIDLNESKKIAERLSNTGFAAIETSGCMWEVRTRSVEELGWRPMGLPESRTGINAKDKEAYHKQYSREIKKVIDVPLILVGGIRSLDVIERVLSEGIADFVSLSRPLIRQPDLPNRWLRGIGGLTSECISCNGCLEGLRVGHVHCTQLNA